MMSSKGPDTCALPVAHQEGQREQEGVFFGTRGRGTFVLAASRARRPSCTVIRHHGPTLTSSMPSSHDPQTPAVGKKAAKTPKKAGKSTKRTKRVESYRFVRPRAFKVAKRRSLRRRPPT